LAVRASNPGAQCRVKRHFDNVAHYIVVVFRDRGCAADPHVIRWEAQYRMAAHGSQGLVRVENITFGLARGLPPSARTAAKFSWYLLSCIGDTRRIIIDGFENDAIEPGLPLVLKLLRSMLGKPHTLYYYSCNCRVAQSLIVAGRAAATHLSLISEERQSWTMLRAWTWE